MASISNGVNGVVRDRLSQMPDDVIVRVLSHLPTIDAVRTVLLRRFGDLWTLVNALSFDFYEYCLRILDGEEITIDDEPSLYNEMFDCFSRFVRNVLMLHRRSTIDSFHLYIYDNFYFDDLEMIGEIQMWLRFAASRGVKDLYFGFNGNEDLTPPRCVFTSQSITKLLLSGCMIEEYEDERPLHMGALRNLSLIGIRGCNDAFNQLISSFPSLEKLVLSSPQGLRLLNITNPSVRWLALRISDKVDDPFTLHCPQVKTLNIEIFSKSSPFQLWVTDVSSLQQVNVMFLPTECWNGLVKAIVKNFRNAADFSFKIDAFEQLSSMNKVDFPQNNWKRLELQPCCSHEQWVQIVLKLVKSSVKLEELVIDVEQSSNMRLSLCSQISASGRKPLLDPELSTDCVYPLLKTVTIHGYDKCCMGLLELVEVLLQNAVVLEKLVITRGVNHIVTVEDRDFLNKVLSFKRASIVVVKGKYRITRGFF